MNATPQSRDWDREQPLSVFISYAHEDVEWKDRLLEFLKPLTIWNDVEVWADDRIDAGAEWYEEIRAAINDSAVALMLVSRHFLGSEFIAKEEVPELLRLRRERGTWVIPVLLNPCPWKSIRWLKRLQIIPDPDTPLVIMDKTNQESFLSDLADDINGFLHSQQSAPRGPLTYTFALDELERSRRTWPGPAECALAEAPVTDTIDISHLPQTSDVLFGRDEELEVLDADWESSVRRVVALVAQGGVGKSALVNRWLREMQADEWRGAERVFGWSFYSQGARGQAASAEIFINSALRFFGDPDPQQGSPWEKGERLAGLIAEHRTLLVLDGLEPLQSPHDFEQGCLRDPGLKSLLWRLTRESQGLCLITSREALPDLGAGEAFRSADLSTITPQDGRALLRSLRVVGTDEELEALAGEFGPLALSVTLLGTWLYEQPNHAAEAAHNLPDGDDPLSRILSGFESLLGDGPALDILHAQGYFDRPAPAEQIAVALGVGSLDRAAIDHLRDLRLLAPRSRQAPDILEAHPLIREHFADQMQQENPDAWRAGHRRLYRHLKETTEYRPDTLAGLQPLYHAVFHGCNAGLEQDACDYVYTDRILRGTGYDGFYSTSKLGAWGADLAAVTCFFQQPWKLVTRNVSPDDRAWFLHQAAYRLRAMGRLKEAVEPMRAGLSMCECRGIPRLAASVANNLSELELTLGDVSQALRDAKLSVTFADRSEQRIEQRGCRCTYANALHLTGQRQMAHSFMEEAEQIQILDDPQHPKLCSLSGFQYCDLLLSDVERAVWQKIQKLNVRDLSAGLIKVCREVEQRARRTLVWETQMRGAPVLDFALHHLSIARARLYSSILDDNSTDELDREFRRAFEKLSHAGDQEFMVCGLLSRSVCQYAQSDEKNCQTDLEEAWYIACAGDMRLHMADILLHRARLFRDSEALKQAADLIEETGYHRRDEELADARQVMGLNE